MRRVSIVFVIGLAAIFACKKDHPESTTPAGSVGPGGFKATTGPRSIDELEAELARYEEELGLRAHEREVGIAEGDAAGVAAPQAKCERTCQLAEAICDLQSRICELADEHQGEARYAESCARAGKDCDFASKVCRDCAA